MLSFVVAAARFKNSLFYRLTKHVLNLILLGLSRRVWVGGHLVVTGILMMLDFDWATLIEKVRRLICRICCLDIALAKSKFALRVMTTAGPSRLTLS